MLTDGSPLSIWRVPRTIIWVLDAFTFMSLEQNHAYSWLFEAVWRPSEPSIVSQSRSLMSLRAVWRRSVSQGRFSMMPLRVLWRRLVSLRAVWRHLAPLTAVWCLSKDGWHRLVPSMAVWCLSGPSDAVRVPLRTVWRRPVTLGPYDAVWYLSEPSDAVLCLSGKSDAIWCLS